MAAATATAACAVALAMAAAALATAGAHTAGGTAAAPALSGAPSAALPGATAAAAPRCASSGLVIWLDTNGNGAAGSTFYSLELTNLSGRTCTLAGYPGVSAVNLRGRQLGSSAKRDTSRRPRTITLAAGASAIATLRIVDAGNFSASACRPVTAAGLRVFPPNQTASKVVPFPFGACSRTGPGYLSVQAVRHG
jgi:hypothetical protein